MNLTKILADLRREREQIDEAILSLERLAAGSGPRRGRPPAWLQAHKGPGRPPGSASGSSIATSKYVEPLTDIFGSRLLFPSEFVGRGDMSRGGLMLRCAREGIELAYIPADSAVRRGKRPPKLPVMRQKG